MKTPPCLFLALTLLLNPAVAHDHFGAGVLDANGNHLPDAGEALQFVGENGTAKIFHLLPRPTGQHPAQRCGGYYMLDERPRTLFPNDAFSFTAISDGQYDANTTGHAHTGAWIWMEIVSVSGPAGAHFGFWDENWSAFNDTPSVSFATGQPTGNYQFVLGEGFDDAAEDPFGHIHGRSWTADKPGDYYVAMRLVDLSTTGPGGGPWHAPSQIYIYHFQAGPDFKPAAQLVAGTGYVLTWASQMGIYTGQTGIVFNIERSTGSLSPSGWQNIGSVTGTTGATSTFTDPTPPAGKAFYRLSYSWSTP